MTQRFPDNAMYPMERQMFERGRRIAPVCGSDIPQALLPRRAESGEMQPGMVPQLAPDVAQVYPVYAPDRILVVSGFIALAAGVTDQARTIQMPEDGYVIGIMAIARGDGSAAGQASLAMRVTVGDEQAQLITNGPAGDFVPFGCLCGLGTVIEKPIERAVHRGEVWSFEVRNNHAATTFTPAVSMSFRTARR